MIGGIDASKRVIQAKGTQDYWGQFGYEVFSMVGQNQSKELLKYFKYFEKRSKLTKNSNFFARGERATLSHHFEPS